MTKPKLSSEDIGTYVVFGMLGAGLGLLVGTFILSLAQQNFINRVNEQETNDYDEEKDKPWDDEPETKTDPKAKRARGTTPGSKSDGRTEDGKSGAKSSTDSEEAGTSVSASGSEPAEGISGRGDSRDVRGDLDQQVLEKAEELRDKYMAPLSAEEAKMVRTGVVDMDTIIEDEGKVDLEVLESKPKLSGYKTVAIVYNAATDSLYQSKRGSSKQTLFDSSPIDAVIDIAIGRILMHDRPPYSYIVDHTDKKLYVLSAAKVTEEDQEEA